MRKHVSFYINGKLHVARAKECFMMLSDFLRYQQGLTGTKVVCAEGDCGACTVLFFRKLPGQNQRPQFFPINSCIILVAQLDACHLVTVEGLKEDSGLSEIQTQIVENHGSQCGYCTPGFAMALTAFFQKPRPIVTEQKIKNCLTGNLCRCTGYKSLIEAGLKTKISQVAQLKSRFLTNNKVKDLEDSSLEAVCVTDSNTEFFAPTNLEDAQNYLKEHPDGKMISGSSDIGVQVNKTKTVIKRIVSLHLIPELYLIEQTENKIKVGARVVLSELRNFCKSLVPELARFIDIFASPQIKNVASLVGNVANASPIGDKLPFLMVSDAILLVKSAHGERKIPISKLYLGYKELSLKPGEIISHIIFKIPKKEELLRLYKVSRRKDLDISTVNGAFLFDLTKNKTIASAKISLGGVGPTVKRLKNTEALLNGKTLSQDLLAIAVSAAQKEINPISDFRGSNQYRRALVDGLFQRYFNELIGINNAHR